MSSQLQYTPITKGVVAASPAGFVGDGAGNLAITLSALPVGETLEVGMWISFSGFTYSSLPGVTQATSVITSLTDQQHFVVAIDPTTPAGTGGGGNMWVSPAQFTDILPSDIAQDKPITDRLMKQYFHTGFYGVVRLEWFDAGYYTDGDDIILPVSKVDGYVYQLPELIFIPIVGSSRQPAPAQFTVGQLNFPLLNSSDNGSGNMLVYPYQLYVDSGGTLQAKYIFGGGTAGQGTIHVLIAAQRQLGTLTFANGIPPFTDIPDSQVRGGSFPTTGLMQQLADNARFGCVRCEVFDLGYYGPGDGVIAAVSPVDGYAYAATEMIYMPLFVSSRNPTGYTPGQLTFPTISGSDSGSGVLLEAPRQVSINNLTGVITSQLYFGGSGITDQGTIHIIGVGQRSSVQRQN